MTGALLGALLAASALAKKPVREPPKLDPWSDEGLAALGARILPLVEREAGRKFVTPPIIRYSQPAAFQVLLAAEQRRIFDIVLADTPPEIRNRIATDAARMESASILGKYGIEDHVTYLCAPAIRDSLPLMGLTDDRGEDVLALILAHELTHALTDQHTDLVAQLGRIHDLDSLHAASGAWEGVATWGEQRVATALGLTDVFDALTGLQGWGPTGLIEPAAWTVYATYGLGRDFTAWHHGRAGIDGVWATLAEPPRETAAIYRPQRWGIPLPEPPIDYAAVLRGLEQEMTTGPWAVSNSRLGELTLRGEAVRADAEAQLEGTLGQLRHAQVLSAERDDRQAELRILEFDSPESVQAWLALLRTQQDAVTAAQAERYGLPVDVKWTPLDEVAGDESALRTQRIPLSGGRWKESISAHVVRGSTCVIVTAVDFRPGLRLGNTVNAIFARLDAARSVSPPHSSP